MLTLIENKWDIKYIQILPGIIEGATENNGEGLHSKKFTQYQTSCTLKIGVFETPDKNIGKLFLKYKLFFLHQANFSSDPSEILILQFPYLKRPCLPHHICQVLS